MEGVSRVHSARCHYLWVDAGADTNVQTQNAMAEGVLLAPRSRFSPSHQPSSRMRLNVATCQEPAFWSFLERELGAMGTK